ncbi:hypothetical protein KP509_28G047700 [Ceratopteris richardii]|nr:hypothetical protein KP509_28G047700 [Ceratopteris richardii]
MASNDEASCNGGTIGSSENVPKENGSLCDKAISVNEINGNVFDSSSELEHGVGLVGSPSLHAADPCSPQFGTDNRKVEFVDESSVSSGKIASKTWASLLDQEASKKISLKESNEANRLTQKEQTAVLVTDLSGNSWLSSLKHAEVTGKRLQPRGLVNKGNLCFLNATLQALLSCSSFIHLLHVLQERGVPKTGFPTISAYVDFFKEFELQPKAEKQADKPPSDVGRPFVPSMFDDILHQFNPQQPATRAPRSRQEDAQEFLIFAMDRLHDELLRLDGNEENIADAKNIAVQAANEDDDWETVGPKNRTALVRTHAFCKSALSDIFGGDLYSVIKTRGSKASATVQPFLVLHLDIMSDAVDTVEDALRLFAAPETLDGYKAPVGKAGVVSASKSVKIQSLPRILILHMKRFSYGAQGSSKLHKMVHFPLNLTLGRDLLATQSSGIESRNYELVATVTHHGKDPSRGHYTAHSKQSNGQWLRYDDAVVSLVGATRVLQDPVYLLFYKRTVHT